ncbi:hypothetical protein [Veronia pacifica]|uniref:Uncharacterized protein n=1 Tax=Veronia pacifica TaxID=1080227 RepID=A0A1C3ESK1_9GAMM|nr:hypothetical protein [Veronia pacifica]ODA36199.1 hypothetical protein A8L45_00930 [Veronia pacifica]
MKVVLFIACFFLIPFTVIAGEEYHQDWMVDTNGNDYFYAATINNNDQIFGKYCYFSSENCLYLIGVDITCEAGSEYPALVNAESAAMHVTLYCGDKFMDQNVLVIEPYEDIDLAIKQGEQLGIAVPMESGQFQVSRFSLDGAIIAIDRMMDAALYHLRENRSLPDSESL